MWVSSCHVFCVLLQAAAVWDQAGAHHEGVVQHLWVAVAWVAVAWAWEGLQGPWEVALGEEEEAGALGLHLHLLHLCQMRITTLRR